MRPALHADRAPAVRPRQHHACAAFPLCPACRARVRDPHDRRFHAEPIACPVCGPQLQFQSDAARRNRRYPRPPCSRRSPRCAPGWCVAVKGVGGYHLLCDAAQRHGREPPARRSSRDRTSRWR
ncbi:MAG: hypothetical protein MZV65_33720 [Chromatiales bacterium]|nr:hypothetical protein [Chromatiales bacterium]